MTALTQAEPRKFSPNVGPHYVQLAVTSDTTIYEGSAVGISSDTARPHQLGDIFGGFATRTVINPSGGSKKVTVRGKGMVILPVNSVAASHIGDTVYAYDDNDFGLTATTGTAIGKVVEFISSGLAWVYFEAKAFQSL